MSRRKASIYCISSNHSRAIENELLTLASMARDDLIKGVTYAFSDQHDSFQIGAIGTHQTDNARTIGVLFKAAVALASVA